MTDEEMAEKFVDTLLKKDNSELDKFLNESLGNLNLTAKQAGVLLGITKGVGIISYLAGLKVKVKELSTETLLKELIDRKVIRSWYYNGTYHVGNELPKGE